MTKNKEPKILLFDIETSPIVAHVWGLWDNNVGLNQIVQDWHVLAWSAKFLDSKKVLYMDQRNAKNIQDDKKTLQGIWDLLDQADVVITQNGKKFDVKKLNARFVINGMKPPSSFKHIDTLVMAKKYFGFTSNKLEYLSDKLNKKYKKLVNRKFSGHNLWIGCLKNNLAAWKEMEKYNKLDVLALEEVYKKLAPWGLPIDLNIFRENAPKKCSCGSTRFSKNGFEYRSTGKYQRFACKKCGAESKDKKKSEGTNEDT